MFEKASMHISRNHSGHDRIGEGCAAGPLYTLSAEVTQWHSILVGIVMPKRQLLSLLASELLGATQWI